MYANCLRDLDPTDYAEACVNGMMQSESGFNGFGVLFRAKPQPLDSAGIVIFDGFVEDWAVSDSWKTHFPSVDYPWYLARIRTSTEGSRAPYGMPLPVIRDIFFNAVELSFRRTVCVSFHLSEP